MSEIDWASLQKEATDVVLADGDYVVQVAKAEATSSSNGKPMIKLQLVIVEGPKKDRKLFTQQVLSAESPFALQIWFRVLAAFGLDAQYFARNPKATIDQIARELMNRGVIATVGTREWQGHPRNEVTGYKPYTPTGPVPPGMVIGAPGTVVSTPSMATGPTPPTTSATPAAPPTVASPSIGTGPTVGPTPPQPARPF